MWVDEFYGSASKQMPYQSIYIDKNIVRNGRREDIYERLDLLPAGTLADKAVLDVGSNFGMNAIGAFKAGAREVTGLERSKWMTNFATRFSVLDGCYPRVQFRQFNGGL